MSKKAQPQPTIKKVKIDEHIKKSTSSNQSITPKKRGRPTGSRKQFNSPQANLSSTSDSIGTTNNESFDANFSTIKPNTSEEIQPIYDTTEEAKGFLRAPFDIAAGLTGIQKLALYPHQLDALAPSFKVVYDKRIAPYMGENADLIAFSMVFLGVAFEKVGVYKEEIAKIKPKENKPQTDSTGTPYIPTEHFA